MSYSGETFRIPATRGGFNFSPNIDLIPDEAMIDGTKNLDLGEDARGRRGGTDIKLSGYGGAQIVGGVDFTLRDDNQFEVVATADGKIWKDDTTTIATGLAANVFIDFTVYNNELYICNGINTPQVWDGSATATTDLALTPTDWTGGSNPFQMIVHGKGASNRLWAVLGENVYAADLDTDGTSEADFSDANVVVIRINTGLGAGIKGIVEFGDRIVAFSSKNAYIIDDTDTDSDNWGYENAQWTGGVASWRLIVETPNDLVCMMEDGEIYSVVTAEQYGDYKEASIARPAFIDRWMRERARLTDIAKFHATYDPELRLIKFFVVKSGSNAVNTALVYYLDRTAKFGPIEAWMLHDSDNASGYDASASWNFRLDPPEDHRDYIHTGDYGGNVWDLEEKSINDNGAAFTSIFKTPSSTFGDPRVTKDYKRGWVVVKPQGATNLVVKTWIDGVLFSTQNVSMQGTGALYGTAIYGTDAYAGDEALPVAFDVGNKGRRIQNQYSNANANEDFLVSQTMTDFKPIGKRPQ